MQGIDQHILFSGNYDLPEHKAPYEIWDNIEIIMMDVPASILPMHKAPITSWSAIEVGLEGKANVRTPAFILLSVLLLLLLFGLTSDNFFSRQDNFTPDKIESFILQNDAPGENKQLIENDLANVLENRKHVANVIVQDSLQEDEAFPSPGSPVQDNISNNQTNNYEQEEIPSEVHELLFLEPKASGLISFYRKDSFLQKYDFSEEDAKAANWAVDQFRDCNYRRTEHMFGLNPGFDYQYLLNSGIPENTKNKYWYTFELRLYYQANRFSLETGLGIGFSKDNIDFSYNYLTNEIIDTYVYVDSAYFDPITGTTHYYTTTVNVYDSLPHSSSSFVEKKYTYLSIPVELGYEIIRKRNFCFGIKAGLTYYKEISLKETEPLIYHENSRITSLGTASCERRKEFVSLLAGIEFRWRMSDGLQFTAEPSYRYFLNQIYLADDKTKGSMSLGLRIGLRYNF